LKILWWRVACWNKSDTYTKWNNFQWLFILKKTQLWNKTSRPDYKDAVTWVFYYTLKNNTMVITFNWVWRQSLFKILFRGSCAVWSTNRCHRCLRWPRKYENQTACPSAARDAHCGTRPNGHKSRFDGVKDCVYENKSLSINRSVSRFLKYTYKYLKFPRIRILIN